MRTIGRPAAYAGVPLARVQELLDAGPEEFADGFADQLDSAMLESSPGAARVLAILEERGWKGWTRIERIKDFS